VIRTVWPTKATTGADIMFQAPLVPVAAAMLNETECLRRLVTRNRCEVTIGAVVGAHREQDVGSLRRIPEEANRVIVRDGELGLVGLRATVSESEVDFRMLRAQRLEISIRIAIKFEIARAVLEKHESCESAQHDQKFKLDTLHTEHFGLLARLLKTGVEFILDPSWFS
jgi:hypothetical protein